MGYFFHRWMGEVRFKSTMMQAVKKKQQFKQNFASVIGQICSVRGRASWLRDLWVCASHLVAVDHAFDARLGVRRPIPASDLLQCNVSLNRSKLSPAEAWSCLGEVEAHTVELKKNQKLHKCTVQMLAFL